MEKTEAKNRIESLRKEIAEHNRRYYVENTPIISDYAFDALLRELTQLEALYPEFITEDSPTQKVGSDLKKENSPFKQYKHLHPMLSLANTYSIEELKEFDARVRRLTDKPFTYNCELKFDGTGINLLYRNGVLIRALTRGDGASGDDVTRNIRTISSIPEKLNEGFSYPPEFEIRGEVYMPFEAFDKLNYDKILNEEQPFANPRNAAAGTLKMLDSSQVAKRGLKCVLYHLIAPDSDFELHSQTLSNAFSWGLPISEHSKKCNTIDEVVEYITSWDTKRTSLPYPTDGVVVKVDELSVQQALGYTAKTPRWAVAYKFKPEEALTKVLSIDYQVGRSGAVTPVANLEPVQLSGTTVKRATLHNAEQMQILNIRIGDYVYVEKGGEIIPKITRVELDKRPADSRQFEFPKLCPSCSTPLIKDPEQAKFFCPNSEGCLPQIEGRFLHFCSRKALDINLGEVAIDQLCQKGYIKRIEDLYSLSDLQLLSLEKWKEKSVKNFRASLQKSKEIPFGRVLYGLGIKLIGETTAKALATGFKNIDNIIEADMEALTAMEDVGPTVAQAIVDFCSNEQNLQTIAALKKAGLQFESKSQAPVSDELKGMTIMITGNYSIPRETMKLYIEAHGGKVGSSVSSSTTYLLAGTKPGDSKIAKAQKLGIPIISEEEFYAIAAGGSAPPQKESATNDDSGDDNQLKLF